MNIKTNEKVIKIAKEKVGKMAFLLTNPFTPANELYDILMFATEKVPDEVKVNQLFSSLELEELKEILNSILETEINDYQKVFNAAISLISETNPLIIELDLFDMLSDTPKEDAKKARVSIYPTGISISAEGYGDACYDGLDSTPILVEYAGGKVRTVVWNDINNDDYTDLIELSDEAKVSSRL